jgi:hypothetical protein
MSNIARNEYADGAPWQYLASDSYLAAVIELGVGGETIIIPEDVVLISATVEALVADASIQITRCPRDVLALGGGAWEDIGSGSTGGTGVVIGLIPDKTITGIRLFIDDSVAAASTARLLVELYTGAAMRGPTIFTPDGGIAKIMRYASAANSVLYELQTFGVDPNSSGIAAVGEEQIAGIIYSNDIPSGGLGLVVYGGTASILLEDAHGSTIGEDVISSGTVAGRVECTAAPAPYTAPDLAMLVGRALSTIAGGADHLVRVALR